MAQSAWLTFRMAREAIKGNRLDEAHRLLEPLLAENYRKAWRIARELVWAYVARANREMSAEPPDVVAAWATLHSAESLNTGDASLRQFRTVLTRFGLVQARAALEAGKPVTAVEVAGRLRDRAVRHPELSSIEDAGRMWLDAAALADRGQFHQALSALTDLFPKLTCPPTGYDKFKAAVELRQSEFRVAVARLHDAADSRQWRVVVDAAEDLLRIAPDYAAARELQRRAWMAVGPRTADYHPDGGANGVDSGSVVPFFSAASHRPPVSPPASPPPFSPDSSSPAPVEFPRRFLLWVDGIAMGGFLVCLSDRVTFGAGTQGGGPMDIPLYADMQRIQADLSRDDEGYVIQSAHPVRVNDRDVVRAVLTDGDRVTLGANFQFVFRTPVPLSTTARLELVSAHRVFCGVEGVLLMGNSLVLGPDGAEAHIEIPDLAEEVLVYRSRDGLGVRHTGSFTVDGRPCRDQGGLPIPATVDGETFRFTLEALGGRL